MQKEVCDRTGAIAERNGGGRYRITVELLEALDEPSNVCQGISIEAVLSHRAVDMLFKAISRSTTPGPHRRRIRD